MGQKNRKNNENINSYTFLQLISFQNILNEFLHFSTKFYYTKLVKSTKKVFFFKFIILKN